MNPSAARSSHSADNASSTDVPAISDSVNSPAGEEGTAAHGRASKDQKGADPLTRLVLAYRVPVLIIFHILAFTAIYLASYLVRFDGVIPPAALSLAWSTAPVIVGLKL